MAIAADGGLGVAREAGSNDGWRVGLDGPGRPPNPAKATPTAKSSKPAKAKPKSRGRRSSSQITATLDRLLTYLGKHPGQRSEQIQKGIGCDKKAISDALGRLRAAKNVTTKGVKRAMTYAV